MLLQGEIPPDIRVEKEAKSLSDNGKYNIVILSNNKSNRLSFEALENISLVRLPYWKFLGKKLNIIKNYPLWFNPFWLFAGFKIAVKIKPNIIHVHDLPLMFLGLILARILGIKLIYDLHENYPATSELWKKKGILSPITRNKKLAEWYDRFSLRKSDSVIIVESEHKSWIEKNYQIFREMFIVSNTVDFDYYLNIKHESSILERYRSNYIVSYIGIISVERNLEIALEALKLVREQISNLLFVIIGSGPDLDRIRTLAHTLEVEDKIEITGWVPFEETKTYIELSNIGLITRSKNDWANTTTPHKLYQYMALGKPVISADADAIKRIVEETKCGVVFRSGNADDLARCIMEIYKNPDKYGKNGKQAAKEKYNWQLSAKNLFRLYEKF